MTDPLRDDVGPWSFDHDRLWRITGPGFVAGFTDYNWEVTGAGPALRDHINYGDNAYYFIYTLCPEKEWKVEKVDDR